MEDSPGAPSKARPSKKAEGMVPQDLPLLNLVPLYIHIYRGYIHIDTVYIFIHKLTYIYIYRYTLCSPYIPK